MLPCLNKTLFGIECPGCGIQRSAALIFQGEFYAALLMYPAIYTLILLFGFLLFNQFVKTRFDLLFKIALVSINLLIIIISYIYKMNQLF